MITYSAEGVKMPKIKKREISRWIKAVAATHGMKGWRNWLYVRR